MPTLRLKIDRRNNACEGAAVQCKVKRSEETRADPSQKHQQKRPVVHTGSTDHSASVAMRTGQGTKQQDQKPKSRPMQKSQPINVKWGNIIVKTKNCKPKKGKVAIRGVRTRVDVEYPVPSNATYGAALPFSAQPFGRMTIHNEATITSAAAARENLVLFLRSNSDAAAIKAACESRQYIVLRSKAIAQRKEIEDTMKKLTVAMQRAVMGGLTSASASAVSLSTSTHSQQRMGIHHNQHPPSMHSTGHPSQHKHGAMHHIHLAQEQQQQQQLQHARQPPHSLAPLPATAVPTTHMNIPATPLTMTHAQAAVNKMPIGKISTTRPINPPAIPDAAQVATTALTAIPTSKSAPDTVIPDDNLDQRRVVAQLQLHMQELQLIHSRTNAEVTEAKRKSDLSYELLPIQSRQQDVTHLNVLHCNLPQKNIGFGSLSHSPGSNNMMIPSILTSQYQRNQRAYIYSQTHLSMLKSRLSHAITISCHSTYPVCCLRFDRTGKYFVTGADDKIVKLFRLGVGPKEAGGGRGMHAFNYCANARGAILVCTLRGHADAVTGIDVSADNSLLATSSVDGDVRVWGLRDGCPIAILRGHKDGANMVSWSTLSPCRLVTCGEDGLARMWDVREAALNRYGNILLPNHKNICEEHNVDDASTDTEIEIILPSVQMTKLEGRQSASAQLGMPASNVNVDADNNFVISSLPLGAGGIGLEGNINQMGANNENNRASPGDFVANNSIDEGVTLLAQLQHGAYTNDSIQDGPSTRAKKKAVNVTCIARCPVGGHFATGSDDGLGRVWADEDDFRVEKNDNKLREFKGNDNTIIPKIEPLFIRGKITAQQQVGLGSSNAPSKERLLVMLSGHNNAITDMKYSNAGDRILTARMKDGDLRIWSWGKECAIIFDGSASNSTTSEFKSGCANFLNMSQLLIQLTPVSQGQSNRHLSKRKGSSSASYNGQAVHCDGVAWTCDDLKIVTSQSSPLKATGTDIIPGSHMIYVWDSHSGRCLMGILSSHSSLCSTLVPHPFLPSVVATAGSDGIVNVWDLEKGDCFYTHKNLLHHGPIEPATDQGKQSGYLDGQFSPDGSHLVLTDENGRVTIFDTMVPASTRLMTSDDNSDSNQAEPLVAPSWMKEQYFANDNHDLFYDSSGYCVERESTQPPYLVPKGARCAHDGLSYSEKVQGTYSKLEGALPLSEDNVRVERDKIRSRSAEVRKDGGMLSRNVRKKATILVKSPGLQEGCENNIIIHADGKLVHYNDGDSRADVCQIVSHESVSHEDDGAVSDDGNDDEDLVQMLSTHTTPSGEYVEDWTVSNHFFRMPRDSKICRKWLCRKTYQGNYLGRKRYCPQVGDSVVYIPRAHHDTLKKFPICGYSAPWKTWPTHSTWSAICCRVTHIRYRFPYEMYYRSRRREEKLQSVAAILTLEITGLPSHSSERDLPWPLPTFVSAVSTRTGSHDSNFEVTIFECDEEDFIIPEYLYTFRLQALERAITANKGSADGIGVTINFPPDGTEDPFYKSYDGILTDTVDNYEEEFHFQNSGYNALAMKWDTHGDSSSEDEDAIHTCVWGVNATEFLEDFPTVPSMGKDVTRDVTAALDQVLQLDPLIREIFHDPVDTNTYVDYLDMIEVPMYLSLIKKRLQNKYYTNKDSVVADMELVKENCYKYNQHYYGYYALASRMYKKFKSLVDGITGSQNACEDSSLAGKTRGGSSHTRMSTSDLVVPACTSASQARRPPCVATRCTVGSVQPSAFENLPHPDSAGNHASSTRSYDELHVDSQSRDLRASGCKSKREHYANENDSKNSDRNRDSSDDDTMVASDNEDLPQTNSSSKLTHPADRSAQARPKQAPERNSARSSSRITSKTSNEDKNSDCSNDDGDDIVASDDDDEDSPQTESKSRPTRRSTQRSAQAKPAHNTSRNSTRLSSRTSPKRQGLNDVFAASCVEHHIPKDKPSHDGANINSSDDDNNIVASNDKDQSHGISELQSSAHKTGTDTISKHNAQVIPSTARSEKKSAPKHIATPVPQQRKDTFSKKTTFLAQGDLDTNVVNVVKNTRVRSASLLVPCHPIGECKHQDLAEDKKSLASGEGSILPDAINTPPTSKKQAKKPQQTAGAFDPALASKVQSPKPKELSKLLNPREHASNSRAGESKEKPQEQGHIAPISDLCSNLQDSISQPKKYHACAEHLNHYEKDSALPGLQENHAAQHIRRTAVTSASEGNNTASGRLYEDHSKCANLPPREFLQAAASTIAGACSRSKAKSTNKKRGHTSNDGESCDYNEAETHLNDCDNIDNSCNSPQLKRLRTNKSNQSAIVSAHPPNEVHGIDCSSPTAAMNGSEKGCTGLCANDSESSELIDNAKNDSHYQDAGGTNIAVGNDHALYTQVQVDESTTKKPPAISEIGQHMQIYKLIKKKLADAKARDVPNAVIFYWHIEQWFQLDGRIDCKKIQKVVDCFESAIQDLSLSEDAGDACFYERCVQDIIEACKADFPLPSHDYV